MQDNLMNVGLAASGLLIRKSLSALLSHMDGVQIVVEVDNPFNDLEQLRKARPDVLLMEADGSARDFEVLSQLRSLLPETRILLLADQVDEDFQFRTIQAGARGFISKDSDPALLEKTLKRVVRGEIWVSHQAASMIIGKLVRAQQPGRRNGAELSRREKQIMTLLADGYRNKEIASLLAVSENTVRAHLVTLYKKIRVSSRLGAALYYFEHSKLESSATPNVPSSSHLLTSQDSLAKRPAAGAGKVV
ncbi:MAG TPA: response regulator transcription factor [Terriglobia bacterium]|nr:response regulator transcription factor [Terriglobia bacterium]